MGGGAAGRGADRGGSAEPGEPLAPPRYSPPSAPEPGVTDYALRDLAAFLARGIVDHPDQVRVEILHSGEQASFELSVHGDDLGHVIGKQGRTARSLRLVLAAAAARRGCKAGLEIAD